MHGMCTYEKAERERDDSNFAENHRGGAGSGDAAVHIVDDLGEIVAIVQVSPYLDIAATETRAQQNDAIAQRAREYALKTLERMTRTSVDAMNILLMVDSGAPATLFRDALPLRLFLAGSSSPVPSS